MWNEKASASEENTITWDIERLIPAFQDDSPIPQSLPGMIELHGAAFYRTNAILPLLKQYNITFSLIPGGCTGLVQGLDVVVNRPLKMR